MVRSQRSAASMAAETSSNFCIGLSYWGSATSDMACGDILHYTDKMRYVGRVLIVREGLSTSLFGQKTGGLLQERTTSTVDPPTNILLHGRLLLVRHIRSTPIHTSRSDSRPTGTTSSTGTEVRRS